MTHVLNPYPAYKDSGVSWLGEIPDHWKPFPLCAFTKPKSTRGRPDLPLLSVYRDYGVIPRNSREDNYNPEGADLSTYKVVSPGDLVLNKMKTWQGSLGISEHLGIVSPAYIVCGLSGTIERRYLHLLLRSRHYVDHYNRLSFGVRVNQWDMRYEDFKRVPIHLPPIEEQHAIARYLNSELAVINLCIRAKRRLIDLLNEQKKTIIHRALTRGLDPNVHLKPSGIDWLGEVPEHWETKRLKWVTRLQRGYDLPQDQRKPGMVPVVSSGGVIDTHCEARAEGPGIVMGRYGSTDAVFFIDKDFWPHNTALFVTDFHGNNRRWCFYLLRIISKADYSFKSAVPGIDRKDLYGIYVPQPPINEQINLVRGVEQQLRAVETVMDRSQREIDLIREYRTRLIADVVTGKVDVRGLAAGLPEVEAAEPLDELSMEVEATMDEDPELAEEEAGADD